MSAMMGSSGLLATANRKTLMSRVEVLGSVNKHILEYRVPLGARSPVPTTARSWTGCRSRSHERETEPLIADAYLCSLR